MHSPRLREPDAAFEDVPFSSAPRLDAAALEALVRAHSEHPSVGLVFNRADSSSRTYYYYKHAEYYASPKSV